ncbi:MAG: ATPase domain-containing protein [Thermoplasmata archaeon]|jgi:KaiC domain protein|nr:KaiC domain-containing protein [Euryarchaeota archaeon]MVT14260.1 KaiC domain-containing protein [Euryarchaeota archaeon]MVT36330.1 KaiC domain-containing protein [Euryarchaeota archaeon]
MERVKTGIYGLDELIGGGIPKGHTVAVIGPFGTGKTTFGMQFLNYGLQNGERCIFISLEEEKESIIRTSEAFGWRFGEYVKNGMLTIIRLDPQDAKATMTRIEGDISQEIMATGAQRLVFDSATLLTMMFREEHEKRGILFSLSRAVKMAGVTSIFTGEVNPANHLISRDGLLEYVVDGVISLDLMKEEYKLRLVLQILKMRMTSHSRDVHPFYIKENGIEVLPSF